MEKIYVGAQKNTDGLLALEIKAPANSKAEVLVIQTIKSNDIWFRFAQPFSGINVSDPDELIFFIKKIISREVKIIITTKNKEWVETTLIGIDVEPKKKRGCDSSTVSW